MDMIVDKFRTRRVFLAGAALALLMGALAAPTEANGPKGGAKPFHQQFPLDWPDGEGFVEATYQVPNGKRLVLEYASLFAFLQPEGQSMFVRIVTRVRGTDAFHTLLVQKQEDYGVLKQFGAAHAVKIYADPGSTVKVSVGRVPFNNTAAATVTLSGVLEPAR
jgi:hypothetical protein